jgi:segregation and condensation protein A
VLKRQEEEKNKPVHQVIQYPFTIEGQKEYILNTVTSKSRVAFIDLFEEAPTRIALIFNFLAILEMLANGFLNLQQGEGFNNFWVTLPEEQKVQQTEQ